jgi:hypothetical protein
MKKYSVVVKANVHTVWEANTEQEAILMAEAWTAEEYGNLVHKANFEVTEVS